MFYFNDITKFYITITLAQWNIETESLNYVFTKISKYLRYELMACYTKCCEVFSNFHNNDAKSLWVEITKK